MTKSLTEMFNDMDTDPRTGRPVAHGPVSTSPTSEQGRVEQVGLQQNGARFVAEGELGRPDDAKRFILGGNATVTFRSKSTGNRFTYRVRLSEDGRMYFVSLLVGENNNSDYQYLGHIFNDTLLYVHGRKSKIGQDAPSSVAFRWVWKQLTQQRLPDALEIWHDGTCGRCGRKLTVPESVKSGFGPECITKLGG